MDKGGSLEIELQEAGVSDPPIPLLYSHITFLLTDPLSSSR